MSVMSATHYRTTVKVWKKNVFENFLVKIVQTCYCSDCVCIEEDSSCQFLYVRMKLSRRLAAICWEKLFGGCILKCSAFLEFDNLAYWCIFHLLPLYPSISLSSLGNFISILLWAVICNFIWLVDVGYIWDELIRSCCWPSCRGDLLVQTATREAQEGPPARRQLFSTHTPISVLPSVTPPFQTHIPGTWINPRLRWKKSGRSWF